MTSRNSHTQNVAALTAAAASLALGLSGCAFKKDKETPADPRVSALEQQLDAKQPLVLEDFKIEFVSGDVLNDYSAIVTWPTGRPLLLTLTHDKNIVTYDVRTQGRSIEKCHAGLLSFRVTTSTPDNQILTSFPIQKACPTDFEVRGTYSDIAALNNVTGRLIVTPGATIAAGSQELTLNLNSIEIDRSATVSVFDSKRSPTWITGSATAPPKISIKAARASGFLKFELNGADGAPLPETVDIANPLLNGDIGTAGRVDNNTPRGGGRGGPDGYVPDNPKCGKQPGNGQPGKAPPQTIGLPGLNGNSAVGTSELTLEIQDATNFSTEVTLNPGLASSATRGSRYLGGKGGDPGPFHAPCSPAKRGDDAPPSAEGAHGAPGKNGSCGAIRVSSNILQRIRIKDVGSSLSCSKASDIVIQLD